MIVHADSFDYMMGHMDNDSVDLTVTSPPYDDLRDYDGYRKLDVVPFALALYKKTKPGGVVVWIVNDQIKNGDRSCTSFHHALTFKTTGFKLHDLMIYKHGTPFPSVNRYTQETELMFILVKGKLKTFNPITVPTKHKRIRKSTDRQKDGTRAKTHRHYKPVKIKSNVWEYNTQGGFMTKDSFAHEHPAIFPEQLAADHIVSWSNPGDLVFDPFCGSGTVPKMAKKLGRRWLGVDVSEKYCDIARRRVDSVQAGGYF